MEPDEQSVYFQSDVYRIPVIGGTPEMALSNAGGFSLSPDEKEFFIFRADPCHTRDEAYSRRGERHGRALSTAEKWPG